MRYLKYLIPIITFFASAGNSQTITHKRQIISASSGQSFDNVYSNYLSIGQTAIGVSNDGIYFNTTGFWGGIDNWITSIDDIVELIPLRYELFQNYPNPFNPSTTIKYTIPEPSYVQLEIFNVLGQRTAIIVDGDKDAGSHVLVWSVDNLPSGVYFYRIQAGDYTETKKMVLLR